MKRYRHRKIIMILLTITKKTTVQTTVNMDINTEKV